MTVAAAALFGTAVAISFYCSLCVLVTPERLLLGWFALRQIMVFNRIGEYASLVGSLVFHTPGAGSPGRFLENPLHI